jgi:hypothetical protein
MLVRRRQDLKGFLGNVIHFGRKSWQSWVGGPYLGSEKGI